MVRQGEQHQPLKRFEVGKLPSSIGGRNFNKINGKHDFAGCCRPPDHSNSKNPFPSKTVRVRCATTSRPFRNHRRENTSYLATCLYRVNFSAHSAWKYPGEPGTCIPIFHFAISFHTYSCRSVRYFSPCYVFA